MLHAGSQTTFAAFEHELRGGLPRRIHATATQAPAVSTLQGDWATIWLPYVSYFFGGAFLGNAVPHFVSGTMGRAFQSPFADPPGKGLSSALVNVGWGALNVLAGYVLVLRVGTFDLRDTRDAAACGAGILVIGMVSARVFGPLRGGNLRGPDEPT